METTRVKCFFIVGILIDSAHVIRSRIPLELQTVYYHHPVYS